MKIAWHSLKHQAKKYSMFKSILTHRKAADVKLRPFPRYSWTPGVSVCRESGMQF